MRNGQSVLLRRGQCTRVGPLIVSLHQQRQRDPAFVAEPLEDLHRSGRVPDAPPRTIPLRSEHRAWRSLCAIVAFGPVHIDEAVEEARALLERANGIIAETAAYRTLARLAAIRGDFEEARDLIRRGREPLRDAGLELWYAATSLPAAFVEAHARDFEALVRIYEEGFARLDELGEHAFASTIAADLGIALLELGRDDEAARWFVKARELGPSGDIATVTLADIGEGLLHARRRELDEAERLVRSGLRHAQTTDFWEFQTRANEALAEVLHLRGRADEARAALTTALAKYEAKGAEPAAERVRRLLAEL